MRRRPFLRLLSVSATAAAVGGVGTRPWQTAAAPSSAAVTDADWPQLARDPQRSNASPQGVNGPYRFYWRWTEVPFASRVQPVVLNGTLYIGSLNGVMYALDAAYDARGGPPRIIWQQELADPIRAGAGVDPTTGTVVVGTQHGAILGLDAGSGQRRWLVQTAGAILAAPLLYNGIAFLGSADGNFYAIRTGDGSLLWRQSIGVPILGSAALSTDGSTVFFAAENVKAYAVSSATGAVRWQTPLQGQSAADRWPVVLGNLVIFRTQPIANFQDLLHTGDAVMDGAGPVQADWNADWQLIKPAITSYLAATPQAQTFFALDASTGQPVGTAPVLYTYGTNDAPSPPVVVGGMLYLPYRARHGIQTDSTVAVHVTTKYDAELGRMDPATLDITGLRTPDTFVYQFRLTSDEGATLSAAGDFLLSDSWERLGGIHLTTGHLEGIAQVAHNTLSCNNNLSPNDNLMQFYESCPFPGPPIGEGNARVGAVAASGRIFWKVRASGLAAIGPANGVSTLPMAAASTSPAPGPLPSATPVSTQQLASYVWTEPTRPVSAPPADLVQALQQHISAMIASNQHLMPYYLERGMHGSGSWPPSVSNGSEPAIVQNSNAFWFDPGELVLTLSMAFPYLSSSLQGQVLSYLKTEMNRFPPLQPLPWPPGSWLATGQAREYYPVPMRNATNWPSVWPPPGPPIQTIYALWAYARYTGDWSYVSSQWSSIRSLFYARKDAINSYAEIAGAIGYARIARQLGNTSEASVGESTAVAAMQNGYSFAQWLAAANSLYPPNVDYSWEPPGRRAPVFFGLTPEVGRYLRDTNLAAVQYTINDVAGYPNGSYLWYATRLGLQGEVAEASYHTPEIGWSIFLAQAYVQQAGRVQLRYWLDRPWGLGDLWYLQKVVATIEAPPGAQYAVTLPVVK
ncbi:MAG: PQQ-binding-like beta-propeller repeat protein [Chloroflexi bacterium]|nr:PQQ-binding-like beta-propeller repeat protein [Chloroflexota bacterium]